MIGQTVSHYKLLKEIGQGGMGKVFLAQDTRLDRKVALKFLLREMQQDDTARKRFLREAKSAAALDHPYICHIHEVGEVEGTSFISMEYVRGMTLRDRVAEGRLPVKEALQKAVEVAEALEKAHQKRIVHRDLKPSNIMLTPEGHVKVMDFGLAKRLDPAMAAESQGKTLTASLTTSGTTVGTLAYMSPEQVRGQEVDARSDIFSFGVMLYEMLSGVHPFKQNSSIETVNAILNQTPRPLSRYVEDIPELLEHTVTKMLAKDVDQRYQLVHDVRTNLIALLDRMGATPTGATRAKQKGLILKTGAATAVVGIILGVLWSLDMLRTGEPDPSHQLTKAAQVAQRQPPRIAVLPFANFSRSQEDEVYSDGLTESLISRLANLEALLVISRTSVMRFKGKLPPIAEIARQLKVDYIVEGSLLKSGNQCRVTAQLIRVADDTHLWARDYRLPWTDIFTIQDEVSETVVRSINVALRPEERKALRQTPTASIAAYGAYVKGLHSLQQYRKLVESDFFEESEQSFQEALQLDPDYVEPRAGLVKLYTQAWSWEGNEELLSEAERIAWQILGLDSCNPTAYALLARARQHRVGPDRQMFEWARKAVECGPNDAEAHWMLNQPYHSRGLYEAAIAHVMKSVRMDPLAVEGYLAMAHHLRLLRRLDEALEWAKKATGIDPHSPLPYLGLGEVYFFRGELDEAEKALGRGLELASDELKPLFEVSFGAIAAKKGDLQTARNIAEKHRHTSIIRGPWSHLYQYMCILAGKKELAVERVEDDRLHTNYRVLVTDPILSSLHTEPRFQEIVRKQYRRWKRDIVEMGPYLDDPPPNLPEPEEFLEQR